MTSSFLRLAAFCGFSGFLLAGCLNSPSDGPRAPSWDTTFTVGGVTFPNDSATARALVTTGSNGRVNKFFEKIRARKSVRVAFLGGSITQGHYSSRQDLRYSTLLVRHLRRAYPHLDTVIEINAGITATGSRFGASRVISDILRQSPDLVIVEHSVNDIGAGPEPRIQATYEGVLRQLLKHDPALAVVALYTFAGNNYNVQFLHSPVASHYGIPQVSYRDAVVPMRLDGRLTFEDLFFDDPHPNDGGMAIAAHLLYTSLKRAAGVTGTGGVTVPAPLVSDLYERAGILSEGDSSMNYTLQGWQRVPLEKGRYAFTTSSSAPSTLTFTTRRREVTLGIHMQSQDTSSIRVVVPGVLDTVLNNLYFFDYTRHVTLFSADTAGLHTIQITHSGAKFTIDNVLYAGPEN